MQLFRGDSRVLVKLWSNLSFLSWIPLTRDLLYIHGCWNDFTISYFLFLYYFKKWVFSITWIDNVIASFPSFSSSSNFSWFLDISFLYFEIQNWIIFRFLEMGFALIELLYSVRDDVLEVGFIIFLLLSIFLNFLNGFSWSHKMEICNLWSFKRSFALNKCNERSCFRVTFIFSI